MQNITIIDKRPWNKLVAWLIVFFIGVFVLVSAFYFLSSDGNLIPHLLFFLGLGICVPALYRVELLKRQLHKTIQIDGKSPEL